MPIIGLWWTMANHQTPIKLVLVHQRGTKMNNHLPLPLPLPPITNKSHLNTVHVVIADHHHVISSTEMDIERCACRLLKNFSPYLMLKRRYLGVSYNKVTFTSSCGVLQISWFHLVFLDKQIFC